MTIEERNSLFFDAITLRKLLFDFLRSILVEETNTVLTEKKEEGQNTLNDQN